MRSRENRLALTGAFAALMMAAALLLGASAAWATESAEGEDPGAQARSISSARVMDKAAPAASAADAGGDAGDNGDDGKEDPDKPFTIALDPGHGGHDPGALGNGLQEKDLNWKIALACKAELEQSYDARVVLTRAENECPSLAERVDRALNADADVFVSLHINSGGVAVRGAEVYHPNNATYHQELYARGQGLARSILAELQGLGLPNRGPKIRNTEAGGTYPDGSASDYYGVIYHSRRAGLLGIIVEHAVITNASDAVLLRSDATLTRIGQADARGIAEYYGLAVTPGWKQVNGKWKHHDGTSYAVGGWRQVDGAWYLFDGSGFMLTGWQNVGGTWYYLSRSGAMHTGWLNDRGTWYYLKPGSGAMATGWVEVDGCRYYLNGSGAMQAGGWKSLGGQWYWLHGSGAAATGWLNDRGTWYWLDKATGAMATGWVLDGKTWYWCDGSGAMLHSQWLNRGGTWYYLTGSGAMATGWINLGGTWYWLDKESGAMATGWAHDGTAWYFMEGSGAMRRGPAWLNQGGTWYWLYPSGAMATGWLNDRGTWYYLKPESGAMATGWVEVDRQRYYLTPGSGAMHVGWLKLDGAWYYLEASGAAARGLRTVGGVEYRFDAKGLWVDDPDLPEALKPALTGIMGTAEVKPADLAALYEAKAKASGGKIVYPAEALGRGGAPDIASFCAIVTEEAAAEGVRADVVFAQMMVETGWLRFGGDVKVEQFNFAGLGATGGGVPGNSFPDVRTGVRAQVQHLKAYACAQPLKQDCVDERFKYVTRGCAPYVEWLGIPDNPEGKGWAADAGYGKKLLAVMAEIG